MTTTILTGIERQILVLICEGKANCTISKELFMTEGAVQNCNSRIYIKLGIDCMRGYNVRALAVRWGMLNL